MAQRSRWRGKTTSLIAGGGCLEGPVVMAKENEAKAEPRLELGRPFSQASLWISFVVALSIVGCYGNSFTSHGGPVRDYVSLVDNLRAAGHTVEPQGPIVQPFFSVEGQVIKVNGADVQVFEYSDAATAKDVAKKISPDGYTVGTTKVSWMAAPHFYRKEKIIVLYLGSDASVQKVLESILGPQFAGG